MEDIYDLFDRAARLMDELGLSFDQALELVRVWEEIRR